MNPHKQLMKDILSVTEQIRRQYPELYKVLTETPLFLPSNEQEISVADFRRYLESLTAQLKTFEESK